MRIFPIKLKISNAYLICGDRNVLVDTGSPGEANKIINALALHGLKLRDLALIIHTHGHSDHCGSTSALLKLHQVPTALHTADLPLVRAGNNGDLRTTRFSARLIKPFVNQPFEPFEPDLVFDQSCSLHEYGLAAEVHHSPGHTAGSISILANKQSAIIGDLIMGGWMGGSFFPKQPDYHYFAESLPEVHQSIKKVLTWPAKQYYVGHGGPLSRESIEHRFRQILLVG